MISVLIPVRNWPLRELVESLVLQLKRAGQPYEILIGEDGSEPEFSQHNQELESIDGVSHFYHGRALGRSANRNFLARTARYPYLLFLDGDAGVADAGFIETYLRLADEDSVICGGTGYGTDPPENPDHILRWKYGRAREEKPASIRQLNPWDSFSTFNFIIPSALFARIRFDETISGYGHEDTLFGYQLRSEGIPVIHADNPLLHLGLEPAIPFLEKCHDSVRNLAILYQFGKIRDEHASRNNLLHSWLVLKRLGMRKPGGFLFRSTRRLLERQLWQRRARERPDGAVGREPVRRGHQGPRGVLRIQARPHGAEALSGARDRREACGRRLMPITLDGPLN
ncbi:MAG: glycosyltransferase [Bacteroidales bacterium]